MTSRMFIPLFTLLVLLASCSTFKSEQISMKDDRYWSGLVKMSEDNRTSIIDVLKKKNLSLYYQIFNDSKDPELLSFWGQSQNFDSGAKKQIISDVITTDLLAQFGLKNEATKYKVVHAGIAHTYGYLFSVLDTPYGYKRKRWTLPTLNFAFSLNGNSLSPESLEGGLLSNVTYFMGTLAFKNDSDRSRLKKLKNVSTEIKTFNYYSLNVEHLDEDLENYTLRTTLLRLPFKGEGEENDYLLIYSIMDKLASKEYLVTAFPIKKDAYKKIVAPEGLGANQPVVLRYNAYLDGLMEQKLVGNRKFFTESR